MKAARWPLVAGSVGLVVLGCVAGFLPAEAGYRMYLYVVYRDAFVLPPLSSSFGACNISHWEYDEEFGYVYPANRVIDLTDRAPVRPVRRRRRR